MLIARVAAAAFAGVLLALAYEPLSLSWLAPVGVALLSIATWRCSARLGALLGFLAGYVWFGLGVSWVSRVAFAAWPGLAVVEALYVALLGLLLAGTSRLPAAAWWQAVTWATVESVRSGWPLGGFPWLRLAHVTPDTPLAALLPAVGVVGTSAAVALLGTSLAFLLLAVAPGRWSTVTSRGRALLAALLGPAALVVATVAVLALLPVHADPSDGAVDRDLRVALVQGDTPGTGVQAMSVPRAVLDNHVDATLDLALEVAGGTEPRPDLVLWPENASDIDPFADPTAFRAISDAVAAVGAPALTGVVVGRGAAAVPGVGWSNRAQLWDAEGEPGEFYDKRHGVPFGEYVPLRGLLTPLFPPLEQIPLDMRSGVRTGVVEVPRTGPGAPAGGTPAGDAAASRSTPVGVLICFEVADTGLARGVVADGAQVVTVPTNNATYSGTAQIRQQLEIARTTALTTHRPVLVAATNGLTALVDADGSVRAELPELTTAVLTATVTPRTDLVPAVAHGLLIDRATWVLAGLGAFFALMRARLARRRPSSEDQADAHDTEVHR